MSLQSYTWDNGTKDSPIILTNDQIKKLISIGKNANIETNVRGWITTSSKKMQKFLKYDLENNFPNLNIICDEELDDLFTLRASTSVIREGTKEAIIVNSDTGVTHDFLKWKYEYTDFAIEGDISEQNIKDRIRIKDGYLEVDTPKENASWSVTLKLSAYPSYYKDEEFNSIPIAAKPYLTFVIMAKKIEDVVVNIDDDIPVNASISAKVKPVPEDSTKLEGAFYTYSTTTPEIINISTSGLETEVIAKNKGKATLTVTVHACNNTITKTNTISFIVYDSIRPMTFFIDQRGSISDPDTMVSANYIVKTNGDLVKLSDNGALGDPDSNVLTWLRKNTHAYVGKITNRIMRLKQLDDTNREKFADGSSSIGYIDNENGEYDVWMKINSNIYYKSESSIPPNSDTINNNYIAITIARELPIGENEDDWQKWDKNTLIAVYPTSIINNIAHSISGKTAKVYNSNSISEIVDNIKNRGTNFYLADYEFRKLLFILFAGYYSNLNSRICGYGTKNVYNNIVYPKITGSTNNLAGTDSTTETGTGAVNPNIDQIIAGEGSDIKTTNFWHIESFQDDLIEYDNTISIYRYDTLKNNLKSYLDYIRKGKSIPIDDTFTPPSDNTHIATINTDKGTYLVETHGRHGGYILVPKTINLGKYVDILGASASNNNDVNVYYSSQQDFYSYTRFGYGFGSNNSNNGLITIKTIQGCIFLGSRIKFKGTDNTVYIINDEIETL